MTRTNELDFFLPERGALCAVSGGLDSMCLLTMAVQWGQAQGRRVAAAHFNHQLRGGDADRDERFVRDWCAAHAIPFFAGRGDVRAKAEREGLSVEEAARTLRYAFLEEVRQREGFDCILTAHHADDSAETMLLNLLRGTGLRGLTGIPPVRGRIRRPLLGMTRAELARYAEAHHVPHVEDATNEKDDMTRNLLRHRVMPVLRAANPRAVENMARTAALLAADEAALHEAAEILLKKAELVPGVSAALPVSALDSTPEAVRSRAVQIAIAAVAGREKDIGYLHVHSVLELERGQVSLPYGVIAVREGETLRLLRQAEPLASQRILPGQTVFFGPWRVRIAADTDEGLPLSVPPGAALSVTGWEARDRLNGRTLKRLCADRGISPMERSALPVLRVNGRAAAVPGFEAEADFAPGRHEMPVRAVFLKETEENEHDE